MSRVPKGKTLSEELMISESVMIPVDKQGDFSPRQLGIDLLEELQLLGITPYHTSVIVEEDYLVIDSSKYLQSLH